MFNGAVYNLPFNCYFELRLKIVFNCSIVGKNLAHIFNFFVLNRIKYDEIRSEWSGEFKSKFIGQSDKI